MLYTHLGARERSLFGSLALTCPWATLIQAVLDLNNTQEQEYCLTSKNVFKYSAGLVYPFLKINKKYNYANNINNYLYYNSP